MDAQRMTISEDTFHPLMVEWHDKNNGSQGTFRCMPDGSSKRLNGKVVTLLHPGSQYDEVSQTRILDMPALTALHLRDWLIAQSPLLEEMAAIERDEHAEKERLYPRR